MDKLIFEWERKAENDGLYAIAVALLRIEHRLDQLAMNREGDCPGTTEKIAMELSRIADNLPEHE